MARRPIRQKDVENPDRILANLLKDYVDGRLGGEQVLHRASVLEIDNVGGRLSGGPDTDNPDEPPNPRGSIRARVVTNSLNSFTEDENLPIFWPLFPYDLMPIKETEHVYVIFEDGEDKTHGLWLTRIPEPNEVHALSITAGTKKYVQDGSNELNEGGGAEMAIQDLTSDPGVARVTDHFTVDQEIPEYNNRTGDRVINGSNNTTIVLSRDRIDSRDSGEAEEAGAIDIVAGRTSGDVSLSDDSSRVLVTMKSDVDSNFSIEAGEASGPEPHVVAKSDHIRIIGRKTHKLIVEDGPTTLVIDSNGIQIETSGEINIKADQDTVLESPNIKFTGNVDVGGSEAEAQVLGDTLKGLLEEAFTIISTAPVDVAGIPSLGIVNAPAVTTQLNAIIAKLATMLSTKNTVD